LVGDRGYIGKELFCKLFVNGIQLITKLKNKMKNCLMSVSDKVLVRKRSIIETINDELKNIAQVEHSRHRSFHNFVNNLMAGIAAYCFFPKKPMLDLERVEDKQLTIF
ncbi:MAG: transposase, partial [Muribaculaceae bacterium]|nr:transposase [Muribaculaceae bacterium]